MEMLRKFFCSARSGVPLLHGNMRKRMRRRSAVGSLSPEPFRSGGRDFFLLRLFRRLA